MAQKVNSQPAMWETQIGSLGREDCLEKEMVTHSSILAWKIPWTEESGGLQSMGPKELDTTEHLTKYIYIYIHTYIHTHTHTHTDTFVTYMCVCVCIYLFLIPRLQNLVLYSCSISQFKPAYFKFLSHMNLSS